MPAEVVVSASLAQTALSPWTEVAHDPGGRKTLADLAPDGFVRDTPNRGYTADAVWLRWKLRNPETTAQLRWFDTGNRTLQEVDLYLVDATGTIQHQSASARLPFAARPLPFANFVFPVVLPGQGTTEVVLRVRSTSYASVKLRPVLWQPDALRAEVRAGEMLWTIILSVLLTLALINLCLWLYLRDISYLLYVGSLFATAWGLCSFDGGIGSAYELLWPDSPAFEQVSNVALVVANALLPTVFIAHLVGLPRRNPRLMRGIWFFVGLTALIVAFQVAGTLLPRDDLGRLLQTAYVLGSLTWMPIFPLLVFGVIAAARKRERMAWYVIAAYTPFLIALVLTIGNAIAHGESPGLTPALLWTGVFEPLVMALALADRFYQERTAKLAAQTETILTLQRSESELEGRVAERTADLAAEKQRTQDLLHNILPVSVATELARYGKAQPLELKSATILFTDFAGFTQAAGTMPAERMVAELNDIFSAFDDICLAHGIEKIKTIGDAYMAAAGVPIAVPDHAHRTVRAALAMCALLEERNRSAAFKWRIRVGIHSGPVVAGVVGKHKYAFDVWGDTVNTASRMESAGEAGKVNISAYTYDLIRNTFDCEYRGKIGAKGKGDIDMYFVNA